MAPVVKDEQTGVECRFTVCLHIIYIIDSLIERSVGIEVLAKLHTDALQVGLQRVAWIMCRSVEAHVLKEVGKTTL